MKIIYFERAGQMLEGWLRDGEEVEVKYATSLEKGWTLASEASYQSYAKQNQLALRDATKAERKAEARQSAEK